MSFLRPVYEIELGPSIDCLDQVFGELLRQYSSHPRPVISPFGRDWTRTPETLVLHRTQSAILLSGSNQNDTAPVSIN